MLCQIEKDIGYDYVPCEKEVLRFATTDLNNVKVVILGRDPYPKLNNNGKPMATGRAFEVRDLKKWDDKCTSQSLSNIWLALCRYNDTRNMKDSLTILNDKNRNDSKKIKEVTKSLNQKLNTPPDQWFDKTEKAGVLWLNTSFTTLNKPGTHEAFWKPFFEQVIKYIEKEKKQPIIYLAWGNEAEKAVEHLINPTNKIIKDNHPSYYKNLFISKNNSFRKTKHLIDWINP